MALRAAIWFDPASWSSGVVPSRGDAADIFGESTTAGDGPSGVDATAGIVSGVTVDLSGVSAAGAYDAENGAHYAQAPNLSAAHPRR